MLIQTHKERRGYTPHGNLTFWDKDRIKREIRSYCDCEYEVLPYTPHHMVDGQQDFNRTKICHMNEDTLVRTYVGRVVSGI